jgi:hypothetical protein
MEAADQGEQSRVRHRFIPVIENRAERSLALELAMTPLRTMDIHSNAARLLPKPMLPNAAKITRTIIRRKKRTSTWVNLNSRGKFGSCAKI